jgi:hypothetical protein
LGGTILNSPGNAPIKLLRSKKQRVCDLKKYKLVICRTDRQLFFFKRRSELHKPGYLLRWLILLTGIASLVWTFLLHGQLYGFPQLPKAGSTIILTVTTVILMIVAFVIQTGRLEKKGVLYKLIRFLDQYLDIQLAILLPGFFFALIFLISPLYLNPFEAFIRQIGMPFLVYVLLLMLVWSISSGYQIMQNYYKKTVQHDRVQVIQRSQLHRNLWVLFIFLTLSNFLASYISSISISGSINVMVSSRFLVESEASIYTYVSAICLLLISVGFGILCVFSSKWSLRAIWAFLSFLFLVFSVDEVISMHEGIIAAIRLVGVELTSSAFAYLLPVGLLILAIIFLAVRTLRANHIHQWGLFLLGFVMLVGGAVFVESITEFLEIVYGEGLMPLLLVKSMLFLEEGLELTGAYTIFFFVMDQFFGRNKEMQLTIGHSSDM